MPNLAFARKFMMTPRERMLDKLERLRRSTATLEGRRDMQLTPRQRLAAIQHWNKLADEAKWDLGRLRSYRSDAGMEDPYNETTIKDETMRDYLDFQQGVRDLGLVDRDNYRGMNPFYTRDDAYKSSAQNQFMAWCHWNGIEPNESSYRYYLEHGTEVTYPYDWHSLWKDTWRE